MNAQLAEGIGQMTDLVKHAIDYGCGPMRECHPSTSAFTNPHTNSCAEALRDCAQKLREDGLTAPAHPAMNGAATTALGAGMPPYGATAATSGAGVRGREPQPHPSLGGPSSPMKATPVQAAAALPAQAHTPASASGATPSATPTLAASNPNLKRKAGDGPAPAAEAPAPKRTVPRKRGRTNTNT
jgi:hypothetical protein